MTFDKERIQRLLNIFNRQKVRKADLEDVASSFISEIYQLLLAKGCSPNTAMEGAITKFSAEFGLKNEEDHLMPESSISYQSSGLENRPKMKEKDDV